jgi:hypothetical protein
MQREVLAVKQRVLGAEHPSTLSTAGNLAEFLKSQGRYDEAEKMEREVLEYRGRSGCITSALEKPGISIASTSAAEPASKRAKQSINRAPEGRSSGAEGEQKESKVVL